MASKYHQKFPVPDGFKEVIHDFAREVIRSQTDDILEFAYNYFSHKAQGKEYQYESKFNVARSSEKETKKHNVVPYDKLESQARNIVSNSNKQQSHHPQAQQNQSHQQATHQSNKPSGDQNRNQSSRSHKSQASNHSGNSNLNQSKGSHTTHPEEKVITKEFMGELYSSAIGQAVEGEDFGEDQAGERSINRDFSHVEEKQVAQEYSSQVYEQAIRSQEGDRQEEEDEGERQIEEDGERELEEQGEEQERQEQEGDDGQNIQNQEGEEEDERQKKQRELEQAGLEGNVEDFEKAALKIQGTFRKKQGQKK